jgi:hypothetical protein
MFSERKIDSPSLAENESDNKTVFPIFFKKNRYDATLKIHIYKYDIFILKKIKNTTKLTYFFLLFAFLSIFKKEEFFC